MNFEPNKLFIGLMDFFAILLPGALAVFVTMDELGPRVVGERYGALSGTGAWAAFLVASYLAGHLAFLIGSMLDDAYDALRGRTVDAQVDRLASGRPLSTAPVRALVWVVLRREQGRAVRAATALRKRTLARVAAPDAINTFQWSKALLTVESPASLAVVHRFEADSKFFRSFAVVLAGLSIGMPASGTWPPIALIPLVAVLLLSMWRYMEQRLKATNQAYWSVLTLAAAATDAGEPAQSPRQDGPTHAGGIVTRDDRGKPEFLVVQASKRPGWVLPKGHLEPGESPVRAAIREVHEETGVWAQIVDEKPLDADPYPDDGGIATVRYFRMHRVATGFRSDRLRKVEWKTLDELRSAKLPDEALAVVEAAVGRTQVQHPPA